MLKTSCGGLLSYAAVYGTASLQTQVRSQAVSQLAVTGRPMRQHTIVPGASELGEVLAGRDIIVPSYSSDSLWRAGRLQADFVRQLDGASSDTLVRVASGLSEQCFKKQCGLAGWCFGGHIALNRRLSRVRRGVAAMGQD